MVNRQQSSLRGLGHLKIRGCKASEQRLARLVSAGGSFLFKRILLQRHIWVHIDWCIREQVDRGHVHHRLGVIVGLTL